MTSTKNDRYYDHLSPPSAIKTTDLLFENNRIPKHLTIFKTTLLLLCRLAVINVWSQNQILRLIIRYSIRLPRIASLFKKQQEKPLYSSTCECTAGRLIRLHHYTKWIYWKKTCKKRSKTEKVNIIIGFYIFKIVQVLNFDN